MKHVLQAETGPGRRMLLVLAHPDDETLGFGGTIARYAADGVEVHIITATSGQKGWFGDPGRNPGEAALGRIRREELRRAGAILGARGVYLLGHTDGELDQVDPDCIVTEIATYIRDFRPQVVLTFGQDGMYGHPDHIAICQFTTAAVVAAANPRYALLEGSEPHQVSKLYYRAARAEYLAAYEEAFGELVMQIDGEERRSPGWANWLITTTVDSRARWRQVWAAVKQHRSQLPLYARLQALPEDRHRYLWGTQEYYRALSVVNGGRTKETDLFAGLQQWALTAAA
jgi:LmbE family N-acetylglucosaminyl deacetylase